MSEPFWPHLTLTITLEKDFSMIWESSSHNSAGYWRELCDKQMWKNIPGLDEPLSVPGHHSKICPVSIYASEIKWRSPWLGKWHLHLWILLICWLITWVAEFAHLRQGGSGAKVEICSTQVSIWCVTEFPAIRKYQRLSATAWILGRHKLEPGTF